MTQAALTTGPVDLLAAAVDPEVVTVRGLPVQATRATGVAVC
ncbi:MAG: hypothetical protein R3B40_29645 [Polyangiales bacterium]